MLRPALPNVFTAFTCHAAVSPGPQFRRVRPSASSVNGLNQRSGLGLTRQSPMTLGRSEPPQVALNLHKQGAAVGPVGYAVVIVDRLRQHERRQQAESWAQPPFHTGLKS